MTVSAIDRVKLALDDISKGKMIILTDHPERENEGDLIIAAETITPEIMNFIIRHSSGIVCLSMLEDKMKQLHLDFMVAPHQNTSMRGTPFLVSIDAKYDITTGVSAAERVKTIQVAIDDHAVPDDLSQPGHIFPLCAKMNGVLERPGHTEGAIDLARLAGLKPAAVLCEVMNPDGSMSRGSQLIAFSKYHNITMLSIDDLVLYRRRYENLIEEEVTTELPLQSYGKFQLTVIKEKMTDIEHVVLSRPNQRKSKKTYVRIHSSCLTGDLLGSMRCDCYSQLHYSMKRISEEGGILIYFTNQEGRGVGLLNKIKAYALQEKGLDTIEANQQLGLPIDSRNYHIAANYLRNHQVDHITLLTNNPAKIDDLKKYGIQHIELEPMPVFCNQYNKHYLNTKKEKLNHSIQDDLLNILI